MAKRRLSRKKARLIFVLALAGFVGVSASVVWRRSIGIAQARSLRELETKRTHLEGERARLARDLQEATSRGRLGGVAERRLGMQIPSDRQVVFIRRQVSDAH